MKLAEEPFDANKFRTEFVDAAPPPPTPHGGHGAPVLPAAGVAPLHDERTMRMVRASVRSYPLTVLSGIPGTGKGVTVDAVMREVGGDPEAWGFDADHEPGWPNRAELVPDDSTSRRDIV